MAETAATWRARQQRLNAFTSKYLKGEGPLLVDGVGGQATTKRIRNCQWWLGWGKADRNGKWSEKLDWHLKYPNSRGKRAKAVSLLTVRRGQSRRHSHNLSYLAHFLTPGVTRFDGVPVCKCAVPILEWCRANGWHGRLVSGWRSIAYSISLCLRMCRRVSCPGRCAGASTNHVGTTCARFAVDVSDYITFRSVVARYNAAHPNATHIFNALPIDLVHFSPTGR